MTDAKTGVRVGIVELLYGGDGIGRDFAAAIVSVVDGGCLTKWLPARYSDVSTGVEAIAKELEQ